ncbi:MAG: hypothetical protein OXH75_17680 [Acidobacteria bacterium]|nr:hypothetical protein [Acidobacteriota bacterium]
MAEQLELRLDYAPPSALKKLHKELKYPDRISPGDLRRVYDRNGLAAALVNARVEASWGDADAITVDGEEDDRLTTIATENNLFDAMLRADLRSEITTWGLFIPGETGEPAVWGADEVEIDDTDDDGLPSRYRVGKDERRVSAEECVHVVDPRFSASVVAGNPRLLGAYNRLLDLERVLGGGSYATFQRAFPRLLFALPDGDFTDAEKKKLKEQIEEFGEAVRKALTLDGGATMQSVDVAVPQLSGTARELLVNVVAGFNVPLTEVTGEALVAHSASINLTSWHARMNRRRTRVLLPRVLRPCLFKLLEVRNLLDGMSESDMVRVDADWTKYGDAPTTVDLTAQCQALFGAVDRGILDAGFVATLLPEQWFGPEDARVVADDGDEGDLPPRGQFEPPGDGDEDGNDGDGDEPGLPN